MAVLIGRFNNANLETKYVADYKELMIREAMSAFTNAMREQGCLEVEETITKSFIKDHVDVDIRITGVVIGLEDFKELCEIAEAFGYYEYTLDTPSGLHNHIINLKELLNKLR